MTGRRFHLLTREEQDALPPPSMLIADWLADDALNDFYGAKDTLKTFLAMSWALAIATGCPDWFGHTVLRHGAVVYIGAESPRGIALRRRAWEHYTKRSAGLFYLLGEPVPLMQAAQVTEFLAEVQRVVGEPPVLIVVDTLHRAMMGQGRESAPEDMGVVVEACERMRRETGASLLINHHESMQGRQRGTTALPDAATTVLHITRADEVVTLHMEHVKDTARSSDRHFRLQAVAGMDSMVLVAANAPVVAPKPLSAKERDTLRALVVLGRPAKSADWVRQAETFGVSERTCYNNRTTLQDAELVSPDGSGSWLPTLKGRALVARWNGAHTP